MQAPWWLAIAIGILSGSLGAFLTYSFNYRKERAQFLRERAEQTYFALDRFYREISADYILWKKLGTQPRTPTEASNSKTAADYSTLSCSCDIYFPHLSARIIAFIESKDALMDSIRSSQLDCDARATNFENAAISLKNALAKQCRRPLTLVTYISIIDSV